MKQKIRVSEATERLSNVGMWGIILAFLVLFVLLPTKGKSEALNLSEAREMVEIKPKNPELRKYKKNQKKMEFKGFKKRKGKYKIR